MQTGSRERILAALRAAGAPRTDRPKPSRRPDPPADLIAELERHLNEAGGALLDWGTRSLDDLPTAIEGLRARASGSTGPGSALLVHGRWAVAESGAVWQVPAGPDERTAALLTDHLVVVLGREAIVADLHDAYDRIDIAAAPFGWFLAGPSKTADLEQSLVLGAHGPRRLTVVLVGAPVGETRATED